MIRNTDNPSSPDNSQARRGWLSRWFGDAAITAYARWVVQWRWPVIAFSLMVAIGTASGAQFLGFATDYRVFFSDDNPQLQAYEELQKVYVRDDNISFVIKPAEGDVFTPGMLTAIRGLTDAAWQIPFTTRVDSLSNFQNSYAEGDDLTVEDLVRDDLVLDAAAIAHIRRIALTEPLLIDRLISPDGTTASVVATVTLPLKSPDESPIAMAHARELAAQFIADNPGARVAITGMAPLNTAFFEASMQDMSTLIPIMYGVLLVVMALLLRSVAGTFTTLLVIGFSAASAMGLAGWAGVKLTPPSSIAPTVILTLAIADSIHLLLTMLKEMRHGVSKYDAIVESVRINFQPVFLTSLTTMIGFLSLNFSDTPPFHDLGNITAAGVGAAWFYSILLLPALVAVLPFRVRVQADVTKSTGMDRLAAFVIARQRPLLIGMSALVVGLGLLVPRLELNDQFVEYFDHSIQFRVDTDFARENLSGIYQANWSLSAGETGGISNPDFLRRTEAFSEWLQEQPGVVHISTLTDIFRRLNRNMHGDDPEWYRLPEDRDLAAQYLLLYEMSLPYGLDLNNQINLDKSATRLIATLDNFTTNDLRALDMKAQAWLGANLPTAAAEATGPFVMFAYISKRNVESMLIGTIVAMLLISLTLILALRSPKLGLLSLVPNVIPAIMAFGIWSMLVGQIDLASSIVTATSLGIVVDATVHFLSKYLRARRRDDSPEEAVRYAFSTVGSALWVTTVILVAGFGVLALSAFKLNQDMGLLTAIAIAAALVADFLLLPPLLLAVDRVKSGAAEQPALATQPAE